jgi:hypothetical protein
MSTTTATLQVRHVSVSILRRAEDVYAFASKPENLPVWAAGLGRSLTRVHDEWIADGPLGRVRVRFTPENDLGVLDHDVELPAGVVVHNPIRVVPNGEGSEVTFTLFRQPDVSDQEYEKDTAAVERDLRTLRTVLESQ